MILVLKPFIDKESKKPYNAGDMYESNDSKRITFLSEQGFIQAPKGETPEQETKPVKKTRGRRSKDGE